MRKHFTGVFIILSLVLFSGGCTPTPTVVVPTPTQDVGLALTATAGAAQLATSQAAVDATLSVKPTATPIPSKPSSEENLVADVEAGYRNAYDSYIKTGTAAESAAQDQVISPEEAAAVKAEVESSIELLQKALQAGVTYKEKMLTIAPELADEINSLNEQMMSFQDQLDALNEALAQIEQGDMQGIATLTEQGAMIRQRIVTAPIEDWVMRARQAAVDRLDSMLQIAPTILSTSPSDALKMAYAYLVKLQKLTPTTHLTEEEKMAFIQESVNATSSLRQYQDEELNNLAGLIEGTSLSLLKADLTAVLQNLSEIERGIQKNNSRVFP